MTASPTAPRSNAWRRTFLLVFSGQAFSLLGSMAVSFALASLVLIVLFVTGSPTIVTVIAFIAARSVGGAFHMPASQAAVPMYVPGDELTRVAGWNFFLQSGTAMAGPVLGAVMMGLLDIAWALALDVAGALAAVGLLLLVRIPHPERREADVRAGGVLAEMRLGWRELAAHRGLLVLAVVLAVNVFIYMPVGALFPLMTREHFGGSAFDASFVEVAFGGGMLAGGVLIGVLGKRLAGPRTISAGVLVLGGTLALAGLLPPGAFPAFVAVCLVMGLSVPLFSAPTTALFQRLIDPAVLGRVNSLVGTMVLGAAPVGLLAAGPLAERFGVPAWFSLSGVLILCVGLFCLASPTIRGLSGGATAPPPVLEGIPPEVQPGAADL